MYRHTWRLSIHDPTLNKRYINASSLLGWPQNDEWRTLYPLWQLKGNTGDEQLILHVKSPYSGRRPAGAGGGRNPYFHYGLRRYVYGWELPIVYYKRIIDWLCCCNHGMVSLCHKPWHSKYRFQPQNDCTRKNTCTIPFGRWEQHGHD